MNNIDMAYLGIQVAAKKINIPTPKMFIIDCNNLGNKEITGTYSFKDTSITFNEDWVNRSGWIEVIITSFHWCVTLIKVTVLELEPESDETIKKWEYEINNYIMPSGMNNEIDDSDYLKQEIKVDAIAFAHWLVKKEFNVETVIPDLVKFEVELNLIKLGI